MGHRFLKAAMLGLVALGLNAPAQAQTSDYPNKPIRIIVSFGPGGGADIIGRIIAQSMQEKMGQAVVIENKPGAAGTLGNEVIANADKDGYTLGIMTAGQIIAATVSKSLRYDMLNAFDAVSLIGTASLMAVVRADYPANNVKELIAIAKKEPGKVVFASPGFGATQHFAAELFKQTAGVNMLHVPYKSSPQAITALLGGEVTVLFDTVSALIGQVQGGKLKALAVTGKDRFYAVPDVPTAIESGVLPGYDVTTWYGVFTTRGTPPAIVAKLNKVINDSLAEEVVRKRLETAGIVVQGSTPQEFAKFQSDEFTRWNKVREAGNIAQQ
jgi:tripartite-type tricarboxylate transporter receptor subunit TctC